MSPAEIESVAKDLGLSMRAGFVPWSQSRNKGDKLPSLNWLVTILKDGREVLTTDYMAGSGHCPAYKASVKQLGHSNSLLRDQAVKWECEHGFQAHVHPDGHVSSMNKRIEPVMADVLHSLVMDADAIDYASFEEWAESFGCDLDSRKAEAVYRACLEIALKLRASLGETGLQTLRDVMQDY